ncbi:hypothetical protein PR202_ga16126 [Eleusine coracana subsp. coracana]|uniref:Uncharacterized protein n=1 Tax=Eleusine coracana subsp. coracana TaxID=191504 RepID=A0AAV5CM06_ELECO|nr:hypothetical protein PR202_ga16126 [Eleusine coracana subsp. coracana]
MSLSLWILSSFVQLQGKEATSIICQFKTGYLSIPYPQRQYLRPFHMSRNGGHHGIQGKS